jgi:benzoyl-CoA 2,3-dioxygenase component A
MPRVKAYSVDEQLTWDELPGELSQAELQAAGASAQSVAVAVEAKAAEPKPDPAQLGGFNSAQYGATIAPWSAAHPYTNLYGPKAADKTVTATVTGNVRVTEVGKDYDTHHIVLDFGAMPFPVLEGQSIGIIPPGVDERGKPHHARQYSIASPRNGERPGYNNLSLTIKRVLEDHSGKPVRGVGSNYMCDLRVTRCR